jgi:hypothetical protein
VPARGEKIIPFASANHKRTIHATCEPEKVVSLDGSLIITAKSPKSTSIRVLQGTRVLGIIPGDDGQTAVPARILGPGPVRLQVVGMGDAGLDSNVFASPLEIVVQE